MLHELPAVFITLLLTMTLLSKALSIPRTNTKAASRRSSAKHRNHKSYGAIVKKTLQNAASAVRTLSYGIQGHFRCALRAFCLATMRCLRWCIQVAFANPTGRYCVLGTSGIGLLLCCLEAYELISIIASLGVAMMLICVDKAEQDLKAASKLARLEGDTTAKVMSELTKAEDAELASVIADSKEPTSEINFAPTSVNNYESSNDSTTEATSGPIAQPVTTEQGSDRASELSTTCDDVFAEQSLPSSQNSTTAGSVRSESSDSESPPTISLAAEIYQDTDCGASSEVGEPALAMTAWLRTGHPGQQEWQWTIMQPSSGNAEDMTPASMQTFYTGYRVVMKNGFLDECVAVPTAARRSRSL